MITKINSTAKMESPILSAVRFPVKILDLAEVKFRDMTSNEKIQNTVKLWVP